MNIFTDTWLGQHVGEMREPRRGNFSKSRREVGPSWKSRVGTDGALGEWGGGGWNGGCCHPLYLVSISQPTGRVGWSVTLTLIL